ncbi:hypothetical protein HOY80DRAFT_985214 [Tuber brumale]|nr:hypothetical protein HOY80DRAFT_985214 [Tuber brumale]
MVSRNVILVDSLRLIPNPYRIPNPLSSHTHRPSPPLSQKQFGPGHSLCGVSLPESSINNCLWNGRFDGARARVKVNEVSSGSSCDALFWYRGCDTLLVSSLIGSCGASLFLFFSFLFLPFEVLLPYFSGESTGMGGRGDGAGLRKGRDDGLMDDMLREEM